nr:hypothetical protein [Tanacetum cinerariifolium]
TFADAVSAIPGIIQKFMTQQMMKAIQEAVQIQTDRLQDSLQQENDEFLRNIDENIKKIIKGQVKNQTKAAYYGHIKWIEDLVPRAMWIQQPIDYNRHALWGVSPWGRKHCGMARIQAFGLDSVRRDDDQIYKFKEGDFKRLRLQDIEDMLLLLVQGKLSNLTVDKRLAFNVSLRMFTRSIVIKRLVEDL